MSTLKPGPIERVKFDKLAMERPEWNKRHRRLSKTKNLSSRHHESKFSTINKPSFGLQ